MRRSVPAQPPREVEPELAAVLVTAASRTNSDAREIEGQVEVHAERAFDVDLRVENLFHESLAAVDRQSATCCVFRSASIDA